MNKIQRLLLLAFFCIFCVGAFAANSFIVRQIKVEGLQRISYGTFLSYLPVRIGSQVSSAETKQIISKLYGTGFFSEIALYRKGGELLIRVNERPVIGSLRIAGNQKIKTNDLLKVLKNAGFVAGRVFDHSVLTGLQQALLQQYYDLGHYSSSVDTQVVKKARNRVAVNITINEGTIAKIKAINIIGNRHFTAYRLKKDFSLTTPTLWSWITGSDQYSRVKLDADLEKLRSYYLDRGFLQFKIDSTQVSITPDKRYVYIVIHVIEGPIYRIRGTQLSGNLLGKRTQLEKLVDVNKGDVFSRQKIIDLDTKFTKFFGNIGYAFPQITPVPAVDQKKHTVFLDFKINPGRKIYVRRIIFAGNTRTAGYVLRQEMRQMEGGMYSLSKINESKRRLEMLGYLTDITTQLQPVEGYPNQVDLNYNVKERSSAMVSGQVGYSDADGFLYGASLSDKNFMGSGRSVSVQFNNSAMMKSYSFSYFNPYFTANQVGLGFNAYVQNVTPDNLDLSSYSTDVYGAMFNLSYPVSEYSSMSYGFGLERTNLFLSASSSTQTQNFATIYGHDFDNLKLTTSWQFSNMDRAIFPTKGVATSFDVEFGIPFLRNQNSKGGYYKKIGYYKVSDDALLYYPINKYFIFEAHGFAGYGNGIGNERPLPFFENFFAGGIGSVRGFEANTLGPKDSSGNAMGGNTSVNGSVGVVFPNPFGNMVRTTAFVDAGNVYNNAENLRNDFNNLRVAAGVQVEWRTPFAPLVFSLATPLHKRSGDDASLFQFSLGASF